MYHVAYEYSRSHGHVMCTALSDAQNSLKQTGSSGLSAERNQLAYMMLFAMLFAWRRWAGSLASGCPDAEAGTAPVRRQLGPAPFSAADLGRL
eukprot:COSAG01_NODE_1445_length_10281_cov_33.445099_15_plen_93_part_00